MHAIILAAGRGVRLGEVTAEIPKALVRLGGMQLIDHVRGALRAAGVTACTVVTGYRAAAVPPEGCGIIHDGAWATTGMIASLMCARRVIEREDDVLVCYADIVFEPQVINAVMKADRAGVSLPVNTEWLPLWRARMEEPLGDLERLEHDDGWRITKIGGRPGALTEIAGQYMGIVRIRGSARAGICAVYDEAGPRAVTGPDAWDMTALLQAYIEHGDPVWGVPVNGGWLEVDTIGDLRLYEGLVTSGAIAKYCKLRSRSNDGGG